MRFLVFGATGRTGREVTKQAIAAGHHVTAFVRDISAYDVRTRPELTIIEGDATRAEEVSQAIDSHTFAAVFSLLGPKTPILPAPELVDATRNIVSSMEKSETSRLIHLSIVSTRPDSEQLGILYDFLAPMIEHNLIREHAIKEEIITTSSLDWTIFQPPLLTEEELTSDFIVRDHVIEEDAQRKLKVSRANLAQAMLDVVEDMDSFGKKLFITE